MKIKPIYNREDKLVAYQFICLGCGDWHTVNIEPMDNKPAWGFNGDVDKPTFTPSLLVKCGHYVTTVRQEKCWCDYHKEHQDEKAPVCYLCHSFITEGKMTFLGDCSHKLAGQTVEMAEM